MRGHVDGLDVEIFEYVCTYGSEESLEVERQTVICFRVPGLDLPTFSLRPKKTHHRIAVWLGYQDITMTKHPDFTREYLLCGPDEAAIRGLFYEGWVAFDAARMRDYELRLRARSGPHVQ
jgi:hypothetical protein